MASLEILESLSPGSLRVSPCLEPSAWDTYVSLHGASSQYHRFPWCGIIEKVFGHRVIPLAADANGAIVGIFPVVLMGSHLFGRFAVSLPFVNYGGLLADNPVVEEALWKHAIAVARGFGARYLEARHAISHPFIEQRKQHKVSMTLALATDPESQWKMFDAKVRNQIRKAEKSGLRFRTGGAEEVSRFYGVFARCMRNLGTPVYDRRLFVETLAAFPESAWVMVVEDGAVPVAAGIALEHRDVLEVPWAGSLLEYRPKCPNNLLYWGAIQHAIARGLRCFDFGRSTPGDGPYRFKEQWGARPLPLVWEYWLAEESPLPDLSPKNEKFHSAIEMWKRLPLPITTWLGPRIVRGIP